MNGAHLHLALNHLPVVGVPMCALVLIAALIMRSRDVRLVAFSLCVLVAALGVAAFLTGESAEEVLEGMVPDSLVETHEEAAEIAIWPLGALGALGAAGLAITRKGGPKGSRLLAWSALVLALVGSAALARTANLGGKIRHEEIRSGFNPEPAREPAKPR